MFFNREVPWGERLNSSIPQRNDEAKNYLHRGNSRPYGISKSLNKKDLYKVQVIARRSATHNRNTRWSNHRHGIHPKPTIDPIGHKALGNDREEGIFRLRMSLTDGRQFDMNDIQTPIRSITTVFVFDGTARHHRHLAGATALHQIDPLAYRQER